MIELIKSIELRDKEFEKSLTRFFFLRAHLYRNIKEKCVKFFFRVHQRLLDVYKNRIDRQQIQIRSNILTFSEVSEYVGAYVVFHQVKYDFYAGVHEFQSLIYLLILKMHSGGSRQVQYLDIPFVFAAVSSPRYTVSGIEIKNCSEIQIIGLSTDSTENEVWIDFQGPSPQWTSRVQCTSTLQHRTSKFVVPAPGTSGAGGIFSGSPITVAYSKRADLKLPASLTVNFTTTANADLSHTGVLFMRFITHTAQ